MHPEIEDEEEEWLREQYQKLKEKLNYVKNKLKDAQSEYDYLLGIIQNNFMIDEKIVEKDNFDYIHKTMESVLEELALTIFSNFW